MTARRPTVIHLVHSLREHYGGPVRSVGQLAQHLARLGLGVHILAADTGPRDGAWQGDVGEDVIVHRVPSRYWRRGRVLAAPAFRGRLAALCRSLGAPLIVHDHGLWHHPSHAAARVTRALGIPRVVSPRGSLTRWAFRHKAWKKRLAWALYQRADVWAATVLHATSEEEAADLRMLGAANPIAVVPNGVALPPPLAVRKARPRVALFLSRISPKKGLLDLVAAWARLRPPGWRCLIAGPDEEHHRADVERAIAAAGMQAVFSFCGAVPDAEKWRLYASAELFVLPTYSENFGMVVAEALACGVPVVTTRGAPWRELETRRCGWWCDVGAAPLAEALRAAVGLNDAERAAMGARGRALIEDTYAWPPMAARLAAVYAWSLGSGPRPACVSVAPAPGPGGAP